MYMKIVVNLNMASNLRGKLFLHMYSVYSALTYSMNFKIHISYTWMSIRANSAIA